MRRGERVRLTLLLELSCRRRHKLASLWADRRVSTGAGVGHDSNGFGSRSM